LYVQKPFYPEGRDHPHVYLLHPPGGVVSGDCLKISIDAKANAGVLVTTPGATRIYRARQEQPLQRQTIALTIAKNAIIEWFPLETIVFNDACVELNTTVDLTDGSRFIGWEICCFGLPACDKTFVKGSFQQHYLLRKNGIPLFVDRLVLDGNPNTMLQGKAGLRANSVAGFFLLGPVAGDAESILDSLRESATEMEMQRVATVSKVGEFYIGRYLGDSAEQAKNIFAQWWTLLRPLLINRKACAPRIWST
jgi:urease accessory protein